MSLADTQVRRFGELTTEPMMGGISIAGLASLYAKPDHPANAVVEFECSQGCGTKLTGNLFFSALTACDACRAKADKAEKLERAKTYWEAICPPAFRETDKDHAGFPKAQYAATQSWPQVRKIGNDDVIPRYEITDESLMFFGPSGKGKSRLAMLLLKRCLVRWGLHVAVMWSEQLKAVRGEREVLGWIARWGKPDVLLLDDSILAAASDSRTTDALKDLLDYRVRFKRVNIVTSQIGGDDVKEQLAKFGKDTKADRELVEAMLRRLRQSYRVISFADITPPAGTENF